MLFVLKNVYIYMLYIFSIFIFNDWSFKVSILQILCEMSRYMDSKVSAVYKFNENLASRSQITSSVTSFRQISAGLREKRPFEEIILFWKQIPTHLDIYGGYISLIVSFVLNTVYHHFVALVQYMILIFLVFHHHMLLNNHCMMTIV